MTRPNIYPHLLLVNKQEFVVKLVIVSEVNGVARQTSAISIKCSFVGMPAVGKTTILKLLTGKRIDGCYVPTQGFDLGRVKFGNHIIKAWDFGGQKAYIKTYLKQYIFGSDVVFVVTDSTPKNVLSTRELIQFTVDVLGEEVCRIVALANKQDLPGHMSADRVEDVLGVPTYPCVAVDPVQKSDLIGIIARELDELHHQKLLQEAIA
ncbi:MAG: ADP-ribosylation factor-like protein [Promethearchaeota archaeon]